MAMGRTASPSTPVSNKTQTLMSLQTKLQGIHNCIADSPIDDLFGFIDVMDKFQKIKPTVKTLKEYAMILLPDKSPYRKEHMIALEDVETDKRNFLCVKSGALKKVKDVADVCEKVVDMFTNSLLMDKHVAAAFEALGIVDRFPNYEAMNWTFLKDTAEMLIQVKEKLPNAKSFFESSDLQELKDVFKKISELSDEAIKEMANMPWGTLKVSKACRNKVLGEYDANTSDTRDALRHMFPKVKTWNKDLNDDEYRAELAEFMRNMSVLEFVRAVNYSP